MIGELPLMIDWGVYFPVSIAAIAVTTLKVEPGAYWDWVTRSSSGVLVASFTRA